MSGTESSNGGGGETTTRIVTAEKWKRHRTELRTLRRLKEEMIAKEKQWEKEREKLESSVRSAKDELLRSKVYKGRNMMRVSTFDEDDHACSKVIAAFIRETVFPRTKFLHSSWSDYAPDNQDSFFFSLREKLKFPRGVSEESFWVNRIVPLVNKKICETRANIAGAVRQGYLG